jgi:DNA-binding response OmpR family regulator
MNLRGGHTPALRILIVDRETSTAALLGAALRDPAYQIFTATSAREGLELIPQLQPDLLILDTQTGGFELLERRESAARTIPVIMMGAAIPDEEILRGWELGVDTFQSKNEESLSGLPVEMALKVERIFRSQAGLP